MLPGIWSVATTWINFWRWIWSRDTVDWGKRWPVDFSAVKTHLVLFESFKMLGLIFFSKFDWDSYIISIAKTAFKKIGPLIRSVKFLSSEVALYLYKSTIQPCMEYFCHIWVGAPSYYLELLDKLQKWKCRSVGPSLAPAFKSLAHCQNLVASLNLFYRYCFGRCSS